MYFQIASPCHPNPDASYLHSLRRSVPLTHTVSVEHGPQGAPGLGASMAALCKDLGCGVYVSGQTIEGDNSLRDRGRRGDGVSQDLGLL